MRVGIYARVSTTEQAEEGHSIKLQEERLTAYCNAKGWIISKKYIDAGFSGSNIKRPAMQTLISDIKSNKIDIVVVYKLDRFTRSQKDCITILEDIMLPNHCDFISINENFDTSTAYGRAMIGILSIFAQLEREAIKERTIAGRKERVKSGLYSGNCCLPIGYDYENGKLVVNEYEAMQVREIYQLYISGVSFTSIVDILNSKGYTTRFGEWKHVNTVKRILFSKLYYGDLKFNDEYFTGKHEAIISKDIYDKVQSVYEANSKSLFGQRKTAFMSKHLLTGFIFCGGCGARMHAKKLFKHDEHSYICYSVSKTCKKSVIDENCKAQPWDAKSLESYVLHEIKNLNLSKVTEIKKKQGDIINDCDTPNILRKQVSDIEKKLNKLVELYLVDGISKEEISSKMIDLNNKKNSLENEINKSSSKKKTTKEIIKLIKSCDFIMSNGTLDEKKTFLASLIEKIVIFNDKIEIRWTF